MSTPDRMPRSMAHDPGRQSRLFGQSDLLPMWVAEPYVDLAPPIVEALEARATHGWYGYEVRPKSTVDGFWEWVGRRHGWECESVDTSVSPSVGSSIGAMIEIHTEPGGGVILQPPVFTDFKPLVRSAKREPVPNPLVRGVDGRYQMDLEGLEAAASDASVRLMILCNPHNPVGRVWTVEELTSVAEICARHDVFVIADEIHADLALPPNQFVPFGSAAHGTDVRWAAAHGPIKAFGLAGLCDSLLITSDEATTKAFRSLSSRLHLTRNNVFGVEALDVAYREGDAWLDEFIDLIASNTALLRSGLPEGIELVEPEATYLAWLDLRALGIDVPDVIPWLAGAGLALSPGHWFGREGAGYARMTTAVPPSTLATALTHLTEAVEAR